MSVLTRGMPIKRLELEFIPSNLTSYDHIVKVNMIKTPGLVGEIQFLITNKYVLAGEESLSLIQHYLHYMSNSVYISNDIYMGGTDLREISSDYSSVNMGTIRMDAFDYLLDYMNSPEEILVYGLTYTYNGTAFDTPLVTSYKPLNARNLIAGNYRPCVTRENLRFRGPNESKKYDKMVREMYGDMGEIYRLNTEARAQLEVLGDLADDTLTPIYDIIDSVGYYRSRVANI